jgi:hypothetical protein
MSAQTKWRSVSFVVVNMACLNRFPDLLAAWLPDGRRCGQEWVARNPTRADRRAGSFKVNTVTGRWADFATGDAGGDPVSLYAYINGLTQTDAARTLSNEWGLK